VKEQSTTAEETLPDGAHITVSDMTDSSGIRQGHWKCHHSIDWVWFPISIYSNSVPKSCDL